MKLKVNYFGMEPRRFIAGTVGSYGFETLELEFSDEWQGLSKKVVFYPAGDADPVQVLYTGTPIPIPAEAYSARGNCRFAVVGYSGEKTLISVSGEMNILDTLPAEANDAVVPTPDEISQIHAMMQTAVDTANALRTDVENGVLDGKTPTIGANGNWFIGGTDTGVYAVGYPMKDEETTEENLWSANRIRAYGNRYHAGELTGEVSGKVIFLDDAFVRPGSEADASVEGETVASGEPSPDAPVTLSPLTEATLTLYGRNLLDPSMLEKGTVNALTGETSEDTTRTRLTLYPLPAGSYHWGVSVPAKTHFYTESGSWISSVNTADFTMPSDAAQIRAVWVDTLANVIAEEPVLTMSSDVSACSFRKQTVTLTLPSLNGVTGARDELDSDAGTGRVTVVRRTAELVLDGTEDWSFGGGVFILNSAIPSAPRSGSGGICTHFPYNTSDAKAGISGSPAIGLEGTTLYAYLPDRPDETVDGFKSWLAAQYAAGMPVRLIYGSAEEETETYTDTSLLKVTPFERTLTLVSDTPVRLTYRRDAQTAIRRLCDRVTALEAAVTSA